jgi:hypothetical protein
LQNAEKCHLFLPLTGWILYKITLQFPVCTPFLSYLSADVGPPTPPIPFSPSLPPASNSTFLKDILDTVIKQLPTTPAGILCWKDNNPTLKG